jgi:3-deoxy-7-phosphoheptulonate synthase
MLEPQTAYTPKIIPGKSSRSQVTNAVRIGDAVIGGPEFTVIAGPCSIESRAQFLETAQAVKSAGASLLRGGIWKLRTNPTAFQGLGSDAFGMVKEVLKETKMGLVSEITDPRQVEALHDVVDMFQVGARNMHNYALLKELGLTKKPVLLKRNFSALIQEWVKAAEYVAAGGNQNIVLCERGIRTFENATRFTFDINAVVWIKAHTSFPIIVDPSHAVGVSNLVPKLALASAAAGADGLIVEVHPRPLEAMSDGPQSLTVPAFKEMMLQLETILRAVKRPLHHLSL